ncbi:hypothetical protein AB0L13_16740 [Saccharopolyspora shandongensis]|uniref:hypothetical protein n=1 Tax=Saccharopolyspora shandongensis TaxID=418495 RepID=UPI003442AD5D
MDTIRITLPVPAPGETVEHTEGDYVILIENTRTITEPVGPEVGEIVGYTVVETDNTGSHVHAAAVEQRPHRTRVRTYTLCDRSEKRKVRRRLSGTPLSIVTCSQCRVRLEKAGAL